MRFDVGWPKLVAVVTADQIAWIDTAMASLGRSRPGPIEVFRAEPWATVSSTLDGEGRRVWFKANESCFEHEAALLSILAAAVPDAVLEPIAVEPETGWFLTDDGGPLATEDDGLAIAETYVRVVVASAELVDEMLAAGVPDRRPAALPALFDAACAHPEAGDAGERCVQERDRFVRACELLAADGRSALADSDIGPHHAFAGPPLRLYDWSDGSVTHPLVPVFNLGRQLDPGPAAARLLTDAWGDSVDGRTAAAASLVARLLGADVWMRVPPEAWVRHPGGIERWVGRLADGLAQAVDFA